MDRVIVGMSGGVDSAVTAYLLKEAGYEVTGVTLKMLTSGDGGESKCCEINDASRVAAVLDIPYYVVHCEEVFREHVICPFIDAYMKGSTPSPCIECNRYVKWAKLMETAAGMGAAYVATGHYANICRLDNGRLTVKRALFADKDQTYMLYKLTQEQLEHTLMPLGGLAKEEVRRIASKAGLPVASKKDSLDICFVPDGHYTDYILDNAEEEPGREIAE